MADEHRVNYTLIFFALCMCTVISVLADYGLKDTAKQLLIGAVLGIALFKATFVLLYFMHIRFEGPWKYVLLAPTMVLAMAIPFTLAPDITFHYYTLQVPQNDAAALPDEAAVDAQMKHAAPGLQTEKEAGGEAAPAKSH